jgi:hypothetical protein
MDPAIAIFVAGLLWIAIVLGPKFGAEDRPAFKDPNVNPRPMVSSMKPADWERRSRGQR